MATYKILVPKPMATTEEGTEVELLTADSIVDTKEEWKEKHMKDWVNNGWAMEVKVEDVSDLDEGEPVRARNDKGHYVADDPSTPDVNEAWEGGEAPEEEKKETKKKTTKKTTAKKTTKKASK